MVIIREALLSGGPTGVQTAGQPGQTDSKAVRALPVSLRGRWAHDPPGHYSTRPSGTGKAACTHRSLNATAAGPRTEFFSELIIYSVAGATVVYEYNLNERQKKQKAEQDADKETRRRAEMRVNEEKQWEEFRELNHASPRCKRSCCCCVRSRGQRSSTRRRRRRPDAPGGGERCGQAQFALHRQGDASLWRAALGSVGAVHARSCWVMRGGRRRWAPKGRRSW